MSKKINEVYQFKITLTGSYPFIWRRILVPSHYSFWDFHVAIQGAMGWLDCHLHSFTVKDPVTKSKVVIGIPSKEHPVSDNKVLKDHKVKISEYFSENNRDAGYEYDFGDSWTHRIRFEKTIKAAAGKKYPKCIDGEFACPPEDCGMIAGFYRLVSVLKDAKNDEYNEMIEWLGGEFDPDKFDPKDVTFDDPEERFILRYVN